MKSRAHPSACYPRPAQATNGAVGILHGIEWLTDDHQPCLKECTWLYGYCHLVYPTASGYILLIIQQFTVVSNA